ncbi:leucine-rich repeat and fibronectin type-III domain-containing protein 5 [Tachysurus ichikawai]
MIPPTSKNFLVNNLAAGTQYDLCVLAIYDDAITSLTATRVIGCVQFTTESEYLRCHFMQSQFLGGTMILIIGGVIVVSVLVFIIILMIRYKVCMSGDRAKGTASAGVQPDAAVSPSANKEGAMTPKGGDECQKTSAPGFPDSLTQSSETSLPDCSTETSVVSQSWDTGGSSGSIKPKRRPAPKPEEKTEPVLGTDTHNTNRNNSKTPLLRSVPPSGPAPLLPSCFRDTPILRRAPPRPSISKYLTLPAEGMRAAPRRFSLNEDLSTHHCYSGKPGNIRCKRSVSMNGMLASVENSDLDKGVYSSSEWILESTV